MTFTPAKLPRIDRVERDPASRGGTAKLDLFWAESVVCVYGEGFGENPVVTLGGSVMASTLVAPGQVRFTVPAGQEAGVFALTVEAGSEISDKVRVRVE